MFIPKSHILDYFIYISGPCFEISFNCFVLCFFLIFYYYYFLGGFSSLSSLKAWTGHTTELEDPQSDASLRTGRGQQRPRVDQEAL